MGDKDGCGVCGVLRESQISEIKTITQQRYIRNQYDEGSYTHSMDISLVWYGVSLHMQQNAWDGVDT